MKRITEETREQIVRLFQEGHLHSEIAGMCNISECSVKKALIAKGFTPEKKRDISENAINKAVKLYEEGERILDILDQCDIPQRLLYKTLDDRKVGRRKIIAKKPRKRSLEHEILELYQQNMSYSEISRQLLRSFSSVKRCVDSALKAGKIEVSERYRLEKEEKEFLMELVKLINCHNRKVSISKVARTFKVDRQRLDRAVRKAKNQ